MVLSRIRRIEERQLRKRTFWAIAGSVGILLFLGLFGVKLLESFSLLLDKLHPSLPNTQPQSVLILPPTLDPLAQATNSASLIITGKGQPDLVVILYADDAEAKKGKVDKDGTFSLPYEAQTDDKHTFSAKLSDDKGNLSELSNVVSTTIKRTKPALEVTAPTNGTTLYGDTNTVAISGKTDPDSSVTINGRFVLVKDDGAFSYTATLTEGDNNFHIVARDIAGNETSLDRKVIYHK